MLAFDNDDGEQLLRIVLFCVDFIVFVRPAVNSCKLGNWQLFCCCCLIRPFNWLCWLFVRCVCWFCIFDWLFNWLIVVWLLLLFDCTVFDLLTLSDLSCLPI